MIQKVICHSDFDGLTCAVLLSEIFKPEHVLITEPKQIRDGNIELTKDDIVADLPIPAKEVYMAFDHHSGTTKTIIRGDWFILDPKAPSCARVIYDEYEKTYPAIRKWEQMVYWADKIDSANMSMAEYEKDTPYNKISITLSSFDKELDKFYIKYLIDKILEYKDIEKVSKLDWVNGRYKYRQYSAKRWREMIKGYVKEEDGIIIMDLRELKEFIPKGNYWELYKMHPNASISIKIANNNVKGETLISMSENMFHKGRNKVHLGELAAKYQGGGHFGASGCSVDQNKADHTIKHIVKELKDGNKNR